MAEGRGRWVVARPGQKCPKRGHWPSWAVLVCHDCGTCFGCHDNVAHKKLRPDFPPYPTPSYSGVTA